MRGLVYAAAVGALLFSGAAHAQAIDAVGKGGGSIILDDEKVKAPLDKEKIHALSGEGGSAKTIVTVTDSLVSFESGVAVSGGFATATTTSGVDLTIFNGSDLALDIGTFGSTIIPAGMGFYLQDRTGDAAGSNIFTGFGQTTGPYTLEDLRPTYYDNNPDFPDYQDPDVPDYGYYGDLLAYSDFNFTIMEGTRELYSLSGSLALLRGEGGILPIYRLDDAALALSDFTTAFDTPYALAYAWGQTHIDVPLNISLLSGQSTTLQYRATVTSRTRAECLDEVTCLVAYSGFGDPIGRGGGAARSAFGAMDASSNPDCVIGREKATITGIVFCPAVVDTAQLFDFTPGGGGGTVPEPATWALLIAGFGMAGAALRRRRVSSYS